MPFTVGDVMYHFIMPPPMFQAVCLPMSHDDLRCHLASLKNYHSGADQSHHQTSLVFTILNIHVLSHAYRVTFLRNDRQDLIVPLEMWVRLTSAGSQ